MFLINITFPPIIAPLRGGERGGEEGMTTTDVKTRFRSGLFHTGNKIIW